MSDLRARPIANREQKPVRVYGCTYGEWFAIAGPIFLLLLWWPGLLLLVVGVLTDLAIVLLIGRRYRSNELRDVIAYWVDLLRYGARAFGPAAADHALRDGAGFLRERARPRRS